MARDAERLLDIDRALERLILVDPRLVRLVECRFFAGSSEQETADALGLSLRTVQRDWLRARAALRRELSPLEPCGAPQPASGSGPLTV